MVGLWHGTRPARLVQGYFSSSRLVVFIASRRRVPATGSRWSPQLAVYVKPRGWRGRLYLALIAPFRHLIVYPSLMRTLSRGWQREVARRSVVASAALAEPSPAH